MLNKYQVPYGAAMAIKASEEESKVVEGDKMIVTDNVKSTSERQLTPEEILKYKKMDKINKLMKEYNDYVRACFNIYKDLATMTTMLNNFKDGATYQLSTAQLQAAGL